MNTLYDQPGSKLRRRGALLRLREYGPRWTLTYKDRSGKQSGRHKSRREIETQVENGEAMGRIIEAVGFSPSFRYEKFRSEWADSNGHVVIDETPIGNFGEIEGQAKWIDCHRPAPEHPGQKLPQRVLCGTVCSMETQDKEQSEGNDVQGDQRLVCSGQCISSRRANLSSRSIVIRATIPSVLFFPSQEFANV